MTTTTTLAPLATKVCSKCGAKKVLEEFNRNTRRKDRRRSECRSCQRAREAANREERRAYMARWYAEHHEEHRAYFARYRAEHQEERRAYGARYRAQAWEQAIAVFKAAGAWCGHEGPWQIDHVNGDGAIERQLRKGYQGAILALDVVRHPERAGTDLQLLCVPCHVARQEKEQDQVARPAQRTRS